MQTCIFLLLTASVAGSEFRYQGLDQIKAAPAPLTPTAQARWNSGVSPGKLNECEFGEWQCVSLDVRAKDESVLGVFEFELDSAECKAKEVAFRYELVKGEDGRWRFDAKTAKNAVETDCAVTALHKGSHHQKLDRMGAVRMIVSSVRKPKAKEAEFDKNFSRLTVVHILANQLSRLQKIREQAAACGDSVRILRIEALRQKVNGWLNQLNSPNEFDLRRISEFLTALNTEIDRAGK